MTLYTHRWTRREFFSVDLPTSREERKGAAAALLRTPVPAAATPVDAAGIIKDHLHFLSLTLAREEWAFK